MGDRLLREVLWRAADARGTERLRLFDVDVGFCAVSTWVGDFDGEIAVARFRVDLDARFGTTALEATWNERSLRLTRDPSGEWRGPRGGHPELAGLVDVDVQWTPFTNTLPIRRLALSPGRSQDIEVVYVQAGSLEVGRRRQRYTRLDRERWRFESLEDPFRADILVDEEGLVVEYPGIATRLAARG